MKCLRTVFLRNNIWHEWKQAYFESAVSWKLSFSLTFDLSYTDNRHVLQEYISRLPTSDDTDSSILACFLVYHSIPSFRKMATTDLGGKTILILVISLSVCVWDKNVTCECESVLITPLSLQQYVLVLVLLNLQCWRNPLIILANFQKREVIPLSWLWLVCSHILICLFSLLQGVPLSLSCCWSSVSWVFLFEAFCISVLCSYTMMALLYRSTFPLSPRGYEPNMLPYNYKCLPREDQMFS